MTANQSELGEPRDSASAASQSSVPLIPQRSTLNLPAYHPVNFLTANVRGFVATR